MKELIKNYPVYFSIVLTLIIAILFGLADFIIPHQLSANLRILIDSAIRALFSIPVIILLGYVYSINGFKHVFSLKGFGKGMFASIAIFVYIIAIALNFIFMTKMNTSNLSSGPYITVLQITTALFEEALFIGLLMSGMLLRLSFSKLGRITMILMAGIVFGFAHIFDLFLNGNMQGFLLNVVSASILGIAFAAIYLYSKNLLSCIFIHALYGIAVNLSNTFVYGVSLDFINKAQFYILYVIIPVFAIVIALKADPYRDRVMTEIRIYGV